MILRGGRVVDPATGRDGTCDLLIADGVIKEAAPDLPVDDRRVIEVPTGLILCPGFIDMHVHLREPGHEHKETVATGVTSAVAGGFVEWHACPTPIRSTTTRA